MMSPLSKRLTIALTTSPIALAELAVDLLALGFAHALRDDLLGGLRGDAAELLGFLRELDFHPDFGFLAVELLRLVERDLLAAGR